MFMTDLRHCGNPAKAFARNAPSEYRNKIKSLDMTCRAPARKIGSP
jgi:hypothetical protein